MLFNTWLKLSATSRSTWGVTFIHSRWELWECFPHRRHTYVCIRMISFPILLCGPFLYTFKAFVKKCTELSPCKRNHKHSVDIDSFGVSVQLHEGLTPNAWCCWPLAISRNPAVRCVELFYMYMWCTVRHRVIQRELFSKWSPLYIQRNRSLSANLASVFLGYPFRSFDHTAFDIEICTHLNSWYPSNAIRWSLHTLVFMSYGKTT